MARGPRALLVRTRESGRRGKLLLALVPVFLVVVAIQAPRVLDTVRGPEAPAETGAADTSPAETTAPEPDAEGAAAPAAVAGELPDTDPPPPREIEKLASLDRFAPKDPFVQQVSSEGGAPAEETPPADTGDTEPTNEAPPPSDEPESGDAGAEVSVNGSVESVLTGRAFPSGDPVFRLEALTPTTATLTLVSGSFSGRRKAVTLQIGQTATLVNQTNGRRYRITVLSVG